MQLKCFDVLHAVAQGTFALNVPIQRDLPNGTAVLTVRDPEMAYSLDAHRLAPHIPVARVSWELRRDDFGPLQPVSAAELPGLIGKCREVFQMLPIGAVIPAELIVGVDQLDDQSFSVIDVYGPTGPLVRAVAASLATADEATARALLFNAHLLRDTGEPQHMFDRRLSRIARGAGRSAAASRCEELAKTLAVTLSDGSEIKRLEVAVRVTLKTAALHDRLSDADRMRGYGPWETVLYFPERPPSQAADEATIASVDAALSALTPAGLAELVDRHGADSGFEDLEVYAIAERTGLPPQHQLIERCAQRSVRQVEDVRPLLTTLLSATAWRQQDGEDDQTTSAYVGWGMVDEYGDLLPSLALLLRLGPRPEDY